MNKVLLAVGLLSAGVAFGQNQTTRPSSTTTNTSNYSTTDTNNENSRNATMGTNSSTNRPTSTTGNAYNRSNSTTGTGSSMGTSGMSTGSYSNSSATGSNGYNSNSMGTGTSTGSSTSGSYNSNSMGTSGSSSSTPSTNSGSYNSNSMGTSGTSTTTPSTNGSYNSNSMGTSGSSTTTPSTNGSYNTNSMSTGTSPTTPSTTNYNSSSDTGTGTSVTTNSTYSTQTTTRPARTNDYKNFAYGIYVGVNTTKFKGEALDANGSATALTGRLGYQAGFFVRGGGRLYGQIGAEYFASSSNYFTAGQGQSAASIRDQINIKYIQVPVYIGYKLTESDRGISAVRVQLGVEYANQIGSTANQFGNLNDFQVKSGTFNGLGQLGFDAGPLFLDLTYHYGFSNAIQQNAGFAGSQRRILSASLGFKF